MLAARANSDMTLFNARFLNSLSLGAFSSFPSDCAYGSPSEKRAGYAPLRRSSFCRLARCSSESPHKCELVHNRRLPRGLTSLLRERVSLRWEATLRRHRGYLITTIVLWIMVAASPAGAGKRCPPGANNTEIKIGQTNPYRGPVSSFGTIAACYHLVNDLATVPWHLGVSSVAPKRMTIGRLTLAALAAGLPTSYQPGRDHPGNRGSS